jgi:hypothetical protein
MSPPFYIAVLNIISYLQILSTFFKFFPIFLLAFDVKGYFLKILFFIKLLRLQLELPAADRSTVYTRKIPTGFYKFNTITLPFFRENIWLSDCFKIFTKRFRFLWVEYPPIFLCDTIATAYALSFDLQ